MILKRFLVLSLPPRNYFWLENEMRWKLLLFDALFYGPSCHYCAVIWNKTRLDLIGFYWYLIYALKAQLELLIFHIGETVTASSVQCSLLLSEDATNKCSNNKFLLRASQVNNKVAASDVKSNCFFFPWLNVVAIFMPIQINVCEQSPYKEEIRFFSLNFEFRRREMKNKLQQTFEGDIGAQFRINFYGVVIKCDNKML